MGYWKSKVLPKIHKVFGKDAAKKLAADEACKSFDASKEEISKQFEEKKTELQPKVLEIYEASSIEIKTLVKEPKEAGVKKHSVKVQKFLEELVKIDFPGTKEVCEASSKYGAGVVAGPVIFVFEKVSTYVVTEEIKPREAEAEAIAVEEEAQKEMVIQEENPKQQEDEDKEKKGDPQAQDPPKA